VSTLEKQDTALASFDLPQEDRLSCWHVDTDADDGHWWIHSCWWWRYYCWYWSTWTNKTQ